MTWKQPPIIKVYEALGSIGDKRITVNGNTAKVRSSEGDKSYDVIYSPNDNAIRANDNASYWAGYLGYPSISFLLATGRLPFNQRLAESLAGFNWKEINTSFKNDFTKTQEFIDGQVIKKYEVDIAEFHKEIEEVLQNIEGLQLQKLPRSQRPPSA